MPTQVSEEKVDEWKKIAWNNNARAAYPLRHGAYNIISIQLPSTIGKERSFPMSCRKAILPN